MTFSPFARTGRGKDSPVYTVIYDGECRLCVPLANALRRWDRIGLLEVIPSQQEGVLARFPWIPAPAYADSLQLVAPDGQTVQGAAAIERLLDLLPRGGWISWVFAIPLVRRFADRIYRWVARNRYRLGCGSHCQIRPAKITYPE
ncbi:MAG: hypothetical protein NVS1B4_22010 [Gemmatimonadaceae bacterium]